MLLKMGKKGQTRKKSLWLNMGHEGKRAKKWGGEYCRGSTWLNMFFFVLFCLQKLAKFGKVANMVNENGPKISNTFICLCCFVA